MAEVVPLPQRSKMGKLKSLPPRRVKNPERRSREYLMATEVEALMEGARQVGRHGYRDMTLIMMAYRHGLRVAELVALRWDQVDLKQGLLHVIRLKQGTPTMHPLRGPELRALRKLQRGSRLSPPCHHLKLGGGR